MRRERSIRTQRRPVHSTPEEKQAFDLAAIVAAIKNPRERLDARRDLYRRARGGDVVALIAADVLMGNVPR